LLCNFFRTLFRNIIIRHIPLDTKAIQDNVKPNPAAEKYPPTNISEYSITRDANARYFRIKLLYNK
jgi:hypothetical protein